MKVIRERRKLEGKCSKCEKPATNGRMCELHRKDTLRYSSNTREERLAAGLCIRCGKELAINSPDREKGQFCRSCYLRVVAHTNLGDSKMWGNLFELAENQKNCPYTGNKLEIGVNASLDHIIPKSKGGTNACSNLQFVYCNGAFDVNRMKGEMTEEEFRNAVKTLYEKMWGRG
jgi:hypothetical protein